MMHVLPGGLEGGGPRCEAGDKRVCLYSVSEDMSIPEPAFMLPRLPFTLCPLSCHLRGLKTMPAVRGHQLHGLGTTPHPQHT